VVVIGPIVISSSGAIQSIATSSSQAEHKKKTLTPEPGKGLGETRHGHFAMQRQKEGNWCWAAVAQAIKSYFSPMVEVEQCAIARPVLEKEGVPHAKNACARPDQFDFTATLQDALSCPVTDNLRLTLPETCLEFERLKAELDAGRPVAARIDWGDGNGHFIAIDGYREFSSGAHQVLVADPLWPDGTAAYVWYDDLVNNYDGAGRWSDSFLLKQ
jgi:hypothetical protein